jgi:hypothetical protein
MDSPKIIALRAGVVFALLGLMPIVALPAVVSKIDALFYAADEALLPAPVEECAPAGRQAVAKSPATGAIESRPVVAGASMQADDDVSWRIARAKRRLQELGASYMLLEAAESDQRAFHFHCRMPVGESPAYSQPFDATGVDPAATMEMVVKAVERWQNPVREVQTAERTMQRR